MVKAQQIFFFEYAVGVCVIDIMKNIRKNCLRCGEKLVITKYTTIKKYCATCRKELTKIAIRNWQKNNPDRISEIKKMSYYKDHEKSKKRCRDWRAKNKEKFRKQKKIQYARKKGDPIFRLNNSMRVCIGKALRGFKNGKHWEALTGYTVTNLKTHLESMFDDKMTWDNYGSYWHVDHVKPLYFFDCSNKKKFKKAWSLLNLRPLEAKANMSKGYRIAA